MKNKFTLGVVAGMSTLALAVPVLAQISSAAPAPTTSSATAPAFFMHAKTLTQQQVTDMAAKDGLFLSNIDALVGIEKSAVAAHQAALTSAAAIVDQAARTAAVQKAQADMRTAIQSAITANPNLKNAMMPFGGGRGMHRGMFGFGRGAPNTAALASKLGMTEADLKAAIAGGKTVQQIAAEKGIVLPAHRGHMNDHDADDAPVTSATTSTSAQ